MFDTGLIEIFRGDDTDGLGYQTINGVVDTDLDLAGCTLTFRYLDFTQTFTGVSSGDTLTITMSSSVTKTFPPGLGFASVRVTDSDGKLRTFNNRIPVIVKTSTPCVGGGSFHICFKKFPELEPLKIFTGGTSYTEYTGYVQRIIDKATASKFGLAMLYDGIDSTDGASTGKAATPAAVNAVIQKLTDEYYNANDVDEKLANKLESVVVSELPSEGDGNTIYLVQTAISGVYDAFMWIDGVWGRIGSSSGGTSDYAALSNKPQINGTTLQGGNNTLYGSSLEVSATDPTKVDAALAGKRGKTDLSYDVTTTALGEPTATNGGYFIVNGETYTLRESSTAESAYWDSSDGLRYVFYDGSWYFTSYETSSDYEIDISSASGYSATVEDGGTTYTITGYVPSTVHDTLALESQIPDVTSKANRSELCGAWAANTAYTTISFVIHENAIYRCTTAHTSGASWDATEQAKWTSATIADILALYLPKSGGTMTGPLNVRSDSVIFGKSSAANIRIGGVDDNGATSPYYLTLDSYGSIGIYTSGGTRIGQIVVPNGSPQSSTIATIGDIPTVISAFTNDSGYITLPATRYAIVALSSTSLTNAAYNTDIAAAITTAKTYTLPAPVFDASNNRQVRDLYLYANVGTGGSVTFASTDASGNPLTFVSDDFSALAADDGLNAWLLSEQAANTFLVKRLALTTGTLP